MIPILQALLGGFSTMFAFIHGLIVYVQNQTRIQTATDGNLDMIAADYFGATIQRQQGQSDASFRAVILANLVRQKCTRQALINILTTLTGIAPKVVELGRPTDTGVYGGPYIGYGVAGAYGCYLRPFQGFVTAYRPPGSGVSNVGGYGSSVGGYNTPSQLEYMTPSMVTDFITDSDIYAAINAVRPAATILWTAIQPAPH